MNKKEHEDVKSIFIIILYIIYSSPFHYFITYTSQYSHYKTPQNQAFCRLAFTTSLPPKSIKPQKASILLSHAHASARPSHWRCLGPGKNHCPLWLPKTWSTSLSRTPNANSFASLCILFTILFFPANIRQIKPAAHFNSSYRDREN